MIDHASDDGFLEELERAAKGLSVVTDRASTDELRRLFGELHGGEHRSGDASAGESRGEASAKDGGSD